MPLKTEAYLQQVARWPRAGRHLLAQFDEETIVVYQAYHPSIGLFAAEHQHFGGPFSYQRMSWIKPNFLWMMYRSGWGTKPNQEVTLAVTLKRPFFDHWLATAVSSSYDAAQFTSQADWKAAVADSEVRLQWDPDHDPVGNKVQRRAIQLGLRGEVLQTYGREAIVEIEDISAFVAAQRPHAHPSGFAALVTPEEHVYLPPQPATRYRLGLDAA